MRLSTVARGVYYELSKNNKKLLLEKENFECLESILESETKNLCSRGNLELLKIEKTNYSKEEMYAHLFNAKYFVDNFLGLSANTPKMGNFSIWDRDFYSMLTLTGYTLGGITAALSIPGYDYNFYGGLLLSFAGIFAFASTHIMHNSFLKTTSYLPITEKIIIEPVSKFILPSDCAHEYTHHLWRKNRIFMQDIEEGFARNVERHYCLHLAEKNNDDRFLQNTLWTHCGELNEAYTWAVNKLGKKAAVFEPLSPVKCKSPNSYSLGSALLRIAEEGDGVNAYKNLINAHLVSKAFSNL